MSLSRIYTRRIREIQQKRLCRLLQLSNMKFKLSIPSFRWVGSQCEVSEKDV